MSFGHDLMTEAGRSYDNKQGLRIMHRTTFCDNCPKAIEVLIGVQQS